MLGKFLLLSAGGRRLLLVQLVLLQGDRGGGGGADLSPGSKPYTLVQDRLESQDSTAGVYVVT